MWNTLSRRLRQQRQRRRSSRLNAGATCGDIGCPRSCKAAANPVVSRGTPTNCDEQKCPEPREVRDTPGSMWSTRSRYLWQQRQLRPSLPRLNAAARRMGARDYRCSVEPWQISWLQAVAPSTGTSRSITDLARSVMLLLPCGTHDPKHLRVDWRLERRGELIRQGHTSPLQGHNIATMR